MKEHDRPAWRLGRISGVVTLAWVMVWASAIAVLGTDRRAFSTLVRLSGNVAARAVLAVVVFAALLHTVDGLGRCLPNAKPERWRAAAWFVGCALGIPAAAVLLWPFVESRVA
jgi:succinate dehydrogenase/fumarate reductase cytochrome b subunit